MKSLRAAILGLARKRWQALDWEWRVESVKLSSPGLAPVITNDEEERFSFATGVNCTTWPPRCRAQQQTQAHRELIPTRPNDNLESL